MDVVLALVSAVDSEVVHGSDSEVIQVIGGRPGRPPAMVLAVNSDADQAVVFEVDQAIKRGTGGEETAKTVVELPAEHDVEPVARGCRFLARQLVIFGRVDGGRIA